MTQPDPRPYFDREGITIYCGDMRDVLPALLPAIADCCVTDPPYGETSLPWDRWQKGWTAAVLRALGPRGSMWCFGSTRMFLDHVDEFADWRLAQDLVWEKHNGSGFHADRFKRVHENILHWYPRAVAWADVYKAPVFTPDATKRTVRRKRRPPHWGEIGEAFYTSEEGGPRLMRSVFFVRSCHGHAEYPTQKPAGVLWPLIEYASPEGGVVLDPFMGSGSVLLAARELGRRAIGIEVNEESCELAARRLARPWTPRLLAPARPLLSPKAPGLFGDLEEVPQ